MRVVIVDDEEPLRKLLRHWIEAEGATVVEPGTAEEGLALAQAGGAPAVALCDIRLPGNDGFWLADQLRAGFLETVVLMTTGVLEFNAAAHDCRSPRRSRDPRGGRPRSHAGDVARARCAILRPRGDTLVAPARALDIMTSERLPHVDSLVLGALTMLQLSASLELPAP